MHLKACLCLVAVLAEFGRSENATETSTSDETADYDKLRDEMIKIMKSKIRKLEEKFDEALKQEVAKLEEAYDSMPKAKCPVIYEKKCFFALLPRSRINFETADKMCGVHRGRAANVYSKSHQQLLQTYLAPFAKSNRNPLTLWVGMNIRPPSQSVTFYDGSEANGTVRWGLPLWPMADAGNPGRTQLALEVGRNPDARHRGMSNLLPDWEVEGVFCEIP